MTLGEAIAQPYPASVHLLFGTQSVHPATRLAFSTFVLHPCRGIFAKLK